MVNFVFKIWIHLIKVYLRIPSNKKPKGQKDIFGDFMIGPPINKTSPYFLDLYSRKASSSRPNFWNVTTELQAMLWCMIG
jgi:hypothetical protein